MLTLNLNLPIFTWCGLYAARLHVDCIIRIPSRRLHILSKLRKNQVIASVHIHPLWKLELPHGLQGSQMHRESIAFFFFCLVYLYIHQNV